MKRLSRFVIFLLLCGYALACNQPRPIQAECVKYKTCGPCVRSFCGWCGDPGSCYSFQSEQICTEPVGFVQSCTDGSAPFPDQVVNTMPYGKPRTKDAGSDK